MARLFALLPRLVPLFVAALLFACALQRQGNPASGPRLLIDEAHHNAHTVDRQLGDLQGLLLGAGAHIDRNLASFTRETLEPYDVLLLPTPRGGPREASLAEKARPALAEDEIEALVAWVESGGGLWVLSEHAPIGESLRPLLSRLGIDNSGGFVEDPAQGGWESRTLLFSREEGSLGDHPILEGQGQDHRVKRVLTFLGESLQGPAGSTALLKLSDTAQDRYLTAEGRVWRDPSPEDRIVPAQGRSQAVAFSLGEGRVVVFGETGLFTAQGLGEDARGPDGETLDNGRLAMNVMLWLAGDL